MAGEVNAIISQAQAIADAQSANVTSAVQAAQTAANASISFDGSVSIPDVTAIEPIVFIPQRLDKTEISTEFDRINNLIQALAANKIAEFLNTFFPINSDAYDEATNWLIDTITIGGTGINPIVEAQIWSRDRDRVNADNLRAQNSAISEFSARGFSMPTGALSKRLQEIRSDGLVKNAESSRALAIKQMEIEIGNIKFAVENALKARQVAVSAAIDYIRALIQGVDSATRYAFQIQDMQATLINAVSNLYNSRLHRDELIIESVIKKGELNLKTISIAVEAFRASVAARVDAAVGGAKASGDTAAAALGSINAIASLAESI